MARNAAHSVETAADHHDIEMRLSTAAKFTRSGMMGMPGAIIMNFHDFRGQSLLQYRFYPAGPFIFGHPQFPSCKRRVRKHIKPTMQRKSTRHRAFDPDPAAPDACCQMPGCTARAGYRAPKSRDTLNDYFWFCLEHVRQYNANWDYYKGMTPGQIEAHLRADTSWQRPSWRLGARGGQTFDEEEVLDPLDILGAGRQRRAQAAKRRQEQAAASDVPLPLRQPLSTLGLAWPVSLDILKARYKDLARQHHPDANGGDRAAEERFKAVNAAYSVVREHIHRVETTSVAQARAG